MKFIYALIPIIIIEIIILFNVRLVVNMLGNTDDKPVMYCMWHDGIIGKDPNFVCYKPKFDKNI